MKNSTLIVVSILLTSLLGKVTVGAENNQKPNVVFFLVDDLGWSDVGCFGSSFYETPHIDRLAGEGVKFTSGYAACHVCSPTRASILTGKYPATMNLTEWLNGRPDKPFQVLLNPDKAMVLDPNETTLAEVLKKEGYATALFGKWHLGRGTSPTGHGFDVHVPHSVNSNLGRRGFYNPKNIPGLDGGEYVTDRLAELAANYIDENKDKPFLLYMSHFSVHDPIHGRPDLVEKYKKKFAKMKPKPGPDYILEGNPDSPTFPGRAELNKLIKRPLYANSYKSYPNDLVKVKQKQDNVQFAGMVEAVDQSLGTLISKLKEHDLEENTIVIFMSDNGGMSVMNGTPARVVPQKQLDTATSSSNLPLRGAKGWLYEGGIRVPMIVKWPHLGKKGIVCDEPVISTDFYPTILEMLGLNYDSKEIDGKSFTRLVKGQEMDRGPIYWHFPHYSNHGMQSPGGAIRDGDYKLLEYFENGTVQLFNLAKDIGEHKDLAKVEVEKTKELTKKLHQWRKQVGAQMMKPNPNYNPSTDFWSSQKSPPGKNADSTNPNTSPTAGTRLPAALASFAPGWKVHDWGGPAMKPGLRTQWDGRKKVLLTHPLSRTVPCVLSRKIEVPAGKKSALELEVTNHPKGNWKLVVLVNGKEVLSKDVEETKWRQFEVDLSKYAGNTVSVELENRATGWSYEAAYWSRIEIVH